MLNQQAIDSNRIHMNRMTQEMIHTINILTDFNDNIPVLSQMFPEIEADMDLVSPYVDYEIKKILKDIIHNEKL